MRQVLHDLGVATPEVLKAGDAAFEKSRGNIRDALRLLYDQFADGQLSVPKEPKEFDISPPASS